MAVSEHQPVAAAMRTPGGRRRASEELARAMSFGPLTDDQVGEIDRILNRTPTPNAG